MPLKSSVSLVEVCRPRPPDWFFCVYESQVYVVSVLGNTGIRNDADISPFNRLNVLTVAPSEQLIPLFIIPLYKTKPIVSVNVEL